MAELLKAPGITGFKRLFYWSINFAVNTYCLMNSCGRYGLFQKSYMSTYWHAKLLTALLVLEHFLSGQLVFWLVKQCSKTIKGHKDRHLHFKAISAKNQTFSLLDWLSWINTHLHPNSQVKRYNYHKSFFELFGPLRAQLQPSQRSKLLQWDQWRHMMKLIILSKRYQNSAQLSNG